MGTQIPGHNLCGAINNCGISLQGEYQQEEMKDMMGRDPGIRQLWGLEELGAWETFI